MTVIVLETMEEVRSVCGPKLIDQIVFKRRVRKLGCVLDSL